MRPSFGFEDMFNSSFAPRFQSLAWMPYGKPDVFVYQPSEMDNGGQEALTQFSLGLNAYAQARMVSTPG